MKPFIIPLLLAATLVHGEPPTGADGSLVPWFRSLQVPAAGGSCCDVSDCRAVRTRIAGGHIEAFIGAKDFRDGPDAWVAVPETAILHQHDNPTGEPIACFYAGRLICFVDGGQT